MVTAPSGPPVIRTAGAVRCATAPAPVPVTSIAGYATSRPPPSRPTGTPAYQSWTEYAPGRTVLVGVVQAASAPGGPAGGRCRRYGGWPAGARGPGGPRVPGA